MIKSTIQVKCDNCRKMVSVCGSGLANSHARMNGIKTEDVPDLWLETQTDIPILELLALRFNYTRNTWRLRVLVYQEGPIKGEVFGDFCSEECHKRRVRAVQEQQTIKKVCDDDLKKMADMPKKEILQKYFPGESHEEVFGHKAAVPVHKQGKISYEEAWLKRNYSLDQPLPAGVRTRVALTKEGRDALELRDRHVEEHQAGKREVIAGRPRERTQTEITADAELNLAAVPLDQRVPSSIVDVLSATEEGRKALHLHYENQDQIRALMRGSAQPAAQLRKAMARPEKSWLRRYFGF